MDVATEIKESELLIQWIDSKIDGLDVPADVRTRLAAGCLDMALEHQKAIILLTSRSLFGSAAALIRLEVDAYVRGVWILYCASDAEVYAYGEDKHKRPFGSMIEDIEKLDAYNVGTLSRFKKASWAAMNSFTHTGIFQVARRNTVDEIRPNYTDAEVVDGLTTANSFGILTAIAIANIAGDEELAEAVFKRGNEYFDSHRQPTNRI